MRPKSIATVVASLILSASELERVLREALPQVTLEPVAVTEDSWRYLVVCSACEARERHVRHPGETLIISYTGGTATGWTNASRAWDRIFAPADICL